MFQLPEPRRPRTSVHMLFSVTIRAIRACPALPVREPLLPLRSPLTCIGFKTASPVLLAVTVSHLTGVRSPHVGRKYPVDFGRYCEPNRMRRPKNLANR